jgi:hypothetical protein
MMLTATEVKQTGESFVVSPTRYYSFEEIAKDRKISVETVRRMFEGVPGVEDWSARRSERPRKGKRKYRTLRVPEYVLQQELRRISQK